MGGFLNDRSELERLRRDVDEVRKLLDEKTVEADELRRRISREEEDRRAERELFIQYQASAQRTHEILINAQFALRGIIDACQRENFSETRIRTAELAEGVLSYLERATEISLVDPEDLP